MNRVEAKRLRRSLLGAAVATIALICAVACAKAQTETWNGGTGNWNVAGNWTPNGVPNSPTVSVSITGSSGDLSSVTLNNLSPYIQNLSLDSYSTLSINQGQTLNVWLGSPSTLTNAGQINVGNSSSTGNIFIAASGATLSGGGTVTPNYAQSMIQSFSPGSSSLVNMDNTIQGPGSIASCGILERCRPRGCPGVLGTRAQLAAHVRHGDRRRGRVPRLPPRQDRAAIDVMVIISDAPTEGRLSKLNDAGPGAPAVDAMTV
jgi:hypothetical protein